MTMSLLEVFVETLEERIRELNGAGKALVTAIERYNQDVCDWNDVIEKKESFKKLLR